VLPSLHKIPIIGRLLSADNNSSDRTTLMVAAALRSQNALGVSKPIKAKALIKAGA
jgi:hypothetical protein